MEPKPTDSSIRIAALLVATLANFLTPFMSSSVNIALPAIGAEFATSAILLSWVPTSFLLPQLCLLFHSVEYQIFMV